jgi:hypothetical protein
MMSLSSILPFRGHVVAFRTCGDGDQEVTKYDTVGLGVMRSDGEPMPLFLYQGLFWTPYEFEENFNVSYLGCFEQGAPIDSYLDHETGDET